MLFHIQFLRVLNATMKKPNFILYIWCNCWGFYSFFGGGFYSWTLNFTPHGSELMIAGVVGDLLECILFSRGRITCNRSWLLTGRSELLTSTPPQAKWIRSILWEILWFLVASFKMNFVWRISLAWRWKWEGMQRVPSWVSLWYVERQPRTTWK